MTERTAEGLSRRFCPDPIPDEHERDKEKSTERIRHQVIHAGIAVGNKALMELVRGAVHDCEEDAPDQTPPGENREAILKDQSAVEQGTEDKIYQKMNCLVRRNELQIGKGHIRN